MNSIGNQDLDSLIARAYWRPNITEKKALEKRQYFSKLGKLEVPKKGEE